MTGTTWRRTIGGVSHAESDSDGSAAGRATMACDMTRQGGYAARLGVGQGARRAGLPRRHRLRSRFTDLRQGASDRSAVGSQRGRERAAPRRPLPRWADAGARRPAQRAAWPGPGVLLRCHRSAQSDVHPLGQSAGVIHHRRIRPAQERRLSRDVHGWRERRATRDGWSSTTPTWDSCRRGPSILPTDGFNPHGISIDEAHNLMVTSDFICPVRTLHVHGGSAADLRGSVRVWDLARRVDHQDHRRRRPGASGRDDGGPVDSARSAPARLHGWHGRQQALPRRYAGRQLDGRVRLRCLLDSRTFRPCRSSCA